MSGIVGSKLNIRGSGLVAKLGTDGQVLTSSGAGTQAAFEDLSAGISWQSVVTASTLTATAGNGYWINTTSNACTITLPGSASNGDEIIFADYARTWGTNKITIDSNGLKYQGDDDSYTVEYTTDGQIVHIVYSDATKGWVPVTDDDVSDAPFKGNSEGIFAYGESSPAGRLNISNKVSNVGVVSSDISGVGTARGQYPGGCEYGGDKGIFGFGNASPGPTAITNLVSNSGVVGSDVSGVGTAREVTAACSYGGDKGIFAYGYNGSSTVSMSNKVSNSGVVASDVSGVGTARGWLAATEYGDDLGIFGYGSPNLSITNLVNNSGVIGSDVSGVGTGRSNLAGCKYGGDKGIWLYGAGPSGSTATSNLISNVGVVGTDNSIAGTVRSVVAATQYGYDKGIVGFGQGPSPAQLGMTNLVSNAGVVAADTAAVGSVRKYCPACSFN